MKFTQFKKWFSVMAFAVTALFVTQTVRAETSPYVLMQQASDKLFADIKSNQATIKKDQTIYVLLFVTIYYLTCK